MRRLYALAFFVFLVVPKFGFACLWDYDTLAMERQRFPEAHELIAGHFTRHSSAYYRWRILDRAAKLNNEQRAIDFDDMAVAYDKLGLHDKAIETIRSKTARWPNERLYETEANLGTFHVHAGRYEEGLQHINMAIKINPDAHFGREIYQKLLIEYLIESRLRRDQLPLNNDEPYASTGFGAFVIASRKPKDEEQLGELQAAAKGVMGMMRFGRHDSPILLEALGDLLFNQGNREDSKMLAARAYLKASYSANDTTASTAYRQKAMQVLEMQSDRDDSEIESDLKREIQQADDFFRQLSDDEKAWIAAGDNLDIEFAKKYNTPPLLDINRSDWKPMSPGTGTARTVMGGLAILFVASTLAVSIVIRKIRRGRIAVAS